MKYEAKNNGSNVAVSTSSGTPWVSITQVGGSIENNVSQGKSAPVGVVDGVITATPYYTIGAGLQSITVDMGASYGVSKITLWHYFADNRIFNNTKTEVSADGVNWTTVYDSSISGTYVETADGKTITFPARNIRYIRDWSNGSSADSNNHWIEVKAFETITATTRAATACDGCHLITEAEWLTIAQNILSVPSNWSNGAVGSGYVYSGHNDNSPANSLAASDDNTAGYINTGNASGNQRRTLTLTNGEVIWDFAGNVSEWTSGQATGGQPGITGEGSFAVKQYTAVNSLGTIVPNVMPSGTGLANAGTWNSSNGIGQLNSYVSDVALRGFFRGGSWSNTTIAGILCLDLSNMPTATSTSIGFRAAK